MPQIESVHFGRLDYSEEETIVFPEGLPAFEQERLFLPVKKIGQEPLVFLQSLQTPELLFLTLPPHQLLARYLTFAAPEDLELLGLAAGRQPEQGREVALLAIVTVGQDRSVTANLMAPIMINLETRRARQVVQSGSGYSHQHTLPKPENS